MSMGGREVWITGIGLVSALGEGVDAHWEALSAGGAPAVDEETFAPYPVHPIVPLELDRQIPKRGDQRQMEAWQRIGTYAAGLALDDAGMKGDEALLDRTDMIVAAGGGERDPVVDAAILNEMRDTNDPERLLNARLASELRPTLFLAQLPNLLAGNISIVHKVTGSSRTLMGEEAAGIAAISSAHGRIAAGQSDICLVGSSYNAERWDMLLLLELGGFLWRHPHRPVWERGPEGGLVTGSMGAFLVLESAEHARARGAAPTARLCGVQSDYTRRRPGEAAAAAQGQLAALSGFLDDRPAVLSGATGVAGLTEEEEGFLAPLAEKGAAVRGLGTTIGHGLEAQFPALVALAAIGLKKGGTFAPAGGRIERPADASASALATCWGHWRGEGMAALRAV